MEYMFLNNSKHIQVITKSPYSFNSPPDLIMKEEKEYKANQGKFFIQDCKGHTALNKRAYAGKEVVH
jgi:hypothetical protein